MAKLGEIMVTIDTAKIKELVEEIEALQAYTLDGNHEQVLVDLEEVVKIISKYVCASDVVQPKEEKKGYWIKDSLISTAGGTYRVRRCSECESYYQSAGYGWNFCPNCGAEMREEKDD